MNKKQLEIAAYTISRLLVGDSFAPRATPPQVLAHARQHPLAEHIGWNPPLLHQELIDGEKFVLPKQKIGFGVDRETKLMPLESMNAYLNGSPRKRRELISGYDEFLTTELIVEDIAEKAVLPALEQYTSSGEEKDFKFDASFSLGGGVALIKDNLKTMDIDMPVVSGRIHVFSDGDIVLRLPAKDGLVNFPLTYEGHEQPSCDYVTNIANDVKYNVIGKMVFHTEVAILPAPTSVEQDRNAEPNSFMIIHLGDKATGSLKVPVAEWDGDLKNIELREEPPVFSLEAIQGLQARLVQSPTNPLLYREQSDVTVPAIERPARELHLHGHHAVSPNDVVIRTQGGRIDPRYNLERLSTTMEKLATFGGVFYPNSENAPSPPPVKFVPRAKGYDCG